MQRVRITVQVVRKLVTALGFGVAFVALSGCGSPQEPNTGKTYESFVNAGSEQGVPPELLLALSYQATRWQEPAIESPAAEGGMGLGEAAERRFGIMGLSEAQIALGAQQLGVSYEAVITDRATNVRAAAAGLASSAVGLLGPKFAETIALEDWRDVVADWSGFAPELAIDYADEVMKVLREGAGRSLAEGEVMELVGNETMAPVFEAPADSKSGLGTNSQNLSASSSIVNHVRPAYSGNYTHGRSRAVDLIVIHTVQGGYAGCISWFLNPKAKVSAHYVVRSSDGDITQMVDEGDTAWHVRSSNSHAIGIEHEGYVSDSAWYTEAMYRRSAALVCDIATRHHLPLDRTHIVGHVDVPGNTHTDPGRYWDWSKYMGYVRAACGQSGGSTGGSSSGGSTGGSSSGGSSNHSGSLLLQGMVYRAGNSSARIAGASVQAGGHSTQTNGAGYYSLKVPAGTYRITASASGYEARSVSRQVSTDGVWGSIGLPVASNSGSGAPSSGGASLVGVVYASPNSSQRIADARVVLSDGRSTRSDASGYFSFSVSAGAYTVSASKTGFSAGSISRTVRAGSKTWASVGLGRPQAAGRLIGVVYEAPDTHKRIAGATVTLSNGASTVSDSSGVFHFELAPGNYTVTGSAAGYVSHSRSRVVSDGREIWGSLGLSKTPAAGATGHLIGVVYASPSSATRVPGASVWTSTGQKATANGSGVYTMSGVPSGAVQIFASAPGYRDGGVQRVVRTGAEVWGSVPLTKVSAPAGAEGDPTPLPTPTPGDPGTEPADQTVQADFQLIAPIAEAAVGATPTFVWEAMAEMDATADSFVIGLVGENDEEPTYLAVSVDSTTFTDAADATAGSGSADQQSFLSPLALAPGRYGWIVIIVDADGVQRFTSNVDTFVVSAP